MSFYSMFGPMMNDSTYGKGGQDNPNRKLGQAVPSTVVGANMAKNPNFNSSAPATPGTPAPTAGTGTPPSSPSGSYNFSDSPLKNGFNYLGQQYDSLTAKPPGQSVPANKPIGKNGVGVPGDQTAASPEKKAVEGMF